MSAYLIFISHKMSDNSIFCIIIYSCCHDVILCVLHVKLWRVSSVWEVYPFVKTLEPFNENTILIAMTHLDHVFFFLPKVPQTMIIIIKGSDVGEVWRRSVSVKDVISPQADVIIMLH